MFGEALSASPLLTQATPQQFQGHVVAQLQEVLMEAFPKRSHRNLYSEADFPALGHQFHICSQGL